MHLCNACLQFSGKAVISEKINGRQMLKTLNCQSLIGGKKFESKKKTKMHKLLNTICCFLK